MTQLPDTSTEAGQREASVMLAKLMPDWTVREGVGVFWIEDEKNDLPLLTIPKYDNIGCKTLYDPANMALAWRVLNWAWVSPLAIPLVDWAGIQPGYKLVTRWILTDGVYLPITQYEWVITVDILYPVYELGWPDYALQVYDEWSIE